MCKPKTQFRIANAEPHHPASLYWDCYRHEDVVKEFNELNRERRTLVSSFLLPESETQAPAGEADAILKLEKQDVRNREIAVENIVDDTRKYIRETEIPQSDFTDE